MFWVPHPLSAADKGWGFSVLDFDPAACLVGIEILWKECQNQDPHPLQTPQRMGHPPPQAIRYLDADDDSPRRALWPPRLLTVCALAPVSKKHSSYNIRLARSSTASRWTRC